MRFDFEVPNVNVDIAYIPEGNNIPPGIIPLDYVHMDHKDKLPSSFLSIEENVLIEEFFGQGAEQHPGPKFIAKGNKFQITHIAKYSIIQNTKIPLFWKHMIINKPEEKINEDSIKVVDYYGEEIDRDYYLVEQSFDTIANQHITTLYINKSSKILFVEYVSRDRIYKKLLNLEAIFRPVGWETMVFNDGDIPPYMYMHQGNEVKTSYTGALYIQYDYQTKLLRKPISNIEDNWYVSILNTEWTVEKNGINYDYSVPEYYFQHSTEDSRFQRLNNKKCKILFENYIRLQSGVDPERLGQVDIFVYNFYTKELRAIATTNRFKSGELFENKVFQLIEDSNTDGIIKLPFNLLNTDIVYASYPVIEDYYEFRFFNFNSDIMNSGGHVAIYIAPNVSEAEFAVFYALIGDRVPKQGQTFGLQGLVFETTNDYFTFIESHNCYHVATIKVSARKEMDIVKLIDVRKVGGKLEDKKLACEITADMFLSDLKDGNLVVPTNDTLIAKLDARALKKKELITYDNNTLEITDDSYKYLEKLHKLIVENLDVSTKAIICLETPVKVSQI